MNITFETIPFLLICGMIRFHYIVYIFLLLITAGLQAQPELYVCQQPNQKIIIDGDLDDWEKVKWTNDFIDITGQADLNPSLQTRVKMMWDSVFFYVAVEMEEPHLWATVKERDKVIYIDNDFEIFIDPDGDTHNYAEIEINALGTVWDLFLTRPYRDGTVPLNSFDIHGLQYAVNLQGSLNDPSDRDTGWTIEMAIPWESLEEITPGKRKPYAGEHWRINFSRVQWDLQIEDDAYMKVDVPEKNWVWTPQGEVNMHMPEKWGYVFFSEKKAGDFITRPQLPAEETIKKELRILYYAQKAIKKAKGRFSEDIEGFSAHIEKPSAFVSKCEIFATDNQYEIVFKDSTGVRWKINQNGKVWKERPVKAWVWMHGNRSLSEEDWINRFEELKMNGIHGILLGGGADILEMAVPLAIASGMEIQSWTWMLNCNDKQVMSEHPEWYSLNRNGISCLEEPPYVGYYKWLCPSRDEVKHYLNQKAGKLLKIEGLSGLHMDYIRHPDVILPSALWEKYGLVQDHEMPEYDYCYCGICRSTFESLHAYDPLDLQDPSADQAWRQYRYDIVTEVVKDLAHVADSMDKKLSAAVFPSPEIARKLVRQDWDQWPLDEVFPMVYHSFYDQDIEWIGETTWAGVRALPASVKLYTGLYIPALTPEDLNIAIRTILHAGASGFCLFEYNALNEEHWRVVRKYMSKYQ
jgi:hypothetical protein